MNKNVEKFLKKVDPDILDLEGQENFEQVADEIYAETQELMRLIHNNTSNNGFDIEVIAYLLAMHNRAINALVEQNDEIRPVLRFITSALLGNDEGTDE